MRLMTTRISIAVMITSSANAIWIAHRDLWSFETNDLSREQLLAKLGQLRLHTRGKKRLSQEDKDTESNLVLVINSLPDQVPHSSHTDTPQLSHRIVSYYL